MRASSSAFASASAPLQQLALELLHPPEGLGPVEALVGDVLDELVELVDGRLHLRALVLLLQLLRRVAEELDVVGRHRQRVDLLLLRRRRRSRAGT